MGEFQRRIKADTSVVDGTINPKFVLHDIDDAKKEFPDSLNVPDTLKTINAMIEWFEKWFGKDGKTR